MFKLLTNANVYAPEHLGRCHVLIAAGKIAYIGPDLPELGNQIPIETYDLEGAFLVPGIIDGHAHITGGGGEAGFKTRVPPVNPSEFSRAGITTVVGVLGTDDVCRDTASLVATVRSLREEGINAYCHTGGYHLPPTTLTGSVRSDIIHIDCILGVGELAVSDHRSSQPTFEELARIASEAHVAGLMTGKAGIVHFHMGDGVRGFELIKRLINDTEIPSRVFNPTHINRNPDLFADAFSLPGLGVVIDITAFPVLDDDDPAISAERSLMEYITAGLPKDKVTVSSDGGGCLPLFDKQGTLLSMDFGRPYTLYQCLKNLLKQGLNPESVLPAFTSNVANLLRLSTKGRISSGVDADLLILDHQFAINGVLINGQWHVKQQKSVKQGLFEGNNNASE